MIIKTWYQLIAAFLWECSERNRLALLVDPEHVATRTKRSVEQIVRCDGGPLGFSERAAMS
jgi:hypothetical protein